MTFRSALLLVLVAVAVGSEGEKERLPAESKESVTIRVDSTPAVVDTAAPVARVETRSPGKAVLLSAFLPGGGQVYTRNYWKAALIAPAELTLGYLSVREYLAKEEARKEEREEDYELHRDRMATFMWWTGAVVVFSMADAYISAQMFGFDEQMQFAGDGSGHGQRRLALVLGLARAGVAFGI